MSAGIPLWGARGRQGGPRVAENRAARRSEPGTFLDLINAVDVIVWEAEAATLRFTFVSQEAERFLGYPVARWTDEPDFWHRHIHPEDREWAVNYTRAATAALRDHRFEYRMVTATGSSVWLRELVNVVAENGRALRLRGVMVDITKRKRVEGELRQSEARFRDFAASSSDFFWEMDEHLRFTYFSERFEQISGMRPEDLLGRTRRETSNPGVDTECWRGHLADLEAHRPFRHFVHPAKNGDDETVWLSISGRPIADARGNFRGYRGTGTDITAQRSAEAAREESEQRFRDFAETAADWFWETDAQMHYRYVSGRFEEIMGTSPEVILGRTHAEFFHGQDDTETGSWKRHFREVQAHKPFENLEFVWQRPDQAMRYLRSSGKPVYDRDGRFQGYRGVCRDVTEAHLLAQHMSYQASHDMLTGLVNRGEFERRVQRVLDTARSNSSEHALCYLDLDQFKVINDTCGHVAGDELLRQIGGLLRERLRKRDTVARLGGDEFGVLLKHCSMAQAQRVANTLREAIDELRFLWEGHSFRVGASIGLVPLNATSGGITAVLSAADAACYAAKDQGRNRIQIYREDDAEFARRHGEMQWVNRIQRALEEERFELAAQPIVPLSTPAQGEHYELLLRMRDENGRIIPPGAFLPAAERYNLSERLDRWVIAHALGWLAAHPRALTRLHLCSINLSGHSLAAEEFLEFVVRQFDQSGVPVHKLCFEITETAAIANLAGATRFIRALTGRGCRFALDDFGSGLSSFAYLKNLPVDFLKIDGAFVKDMVDDPLDLAMVKSINDVGRVMGKRTIAEFVEDDATLAKLREVGVDYAQGFGVGPPRPLDEHDQP